jgi:glycolate oxidase FAD binding subunit
MEYSFHRRTCTCVGGEYAGVDQTGESANTDTKLSTGIGARIDKTVTERLLPNSHDEVLEALRWALANENTLEIYAGASKRGWGKPCTAEYCMDLSGLTGVTLYEPDELVLTARPGTKLTEIEALLRVEGQQLAFEPPDFGPLFGGAPGAQTLGGVVATNQSGPRRIKAGAARDHFLGFNAVSGRAETFKSGGRVVKNVTGYDLSKLMAGSFGTLGVMTEITVKVLPAPEKLRTVLVIGLDREAATQAMTQALNSEHDVSAASFLPVSISARSSVGYVREAGASVTALRIEGPALSVEHRCNALRAIMAEFGPVEELHRHNSSDFWRELADVSVLLPDLDLAVWRMSVAPSDSVALLDFVEQELGGEAYSDWAGGLIWAALPTDEASATMLRARMAGFDGHATLFCAPEALRQVVPVFPPQGDALAALSSRLKEQFDPRALLNPGRMG